MSKPRDIHREQHEAYWSGLSDFHKEIIKWFASKWPDDDASRRNNLVGQFVGQHHSQLPPIKEQYKWASQYEDELKFFIKEQMEP